MRWFLTSLLLLGCSQLPRVPSMPDDVSGGEIVARAAAAAGGPSWQRPQTLQLDGYAIVHQDGGQQTLDDYRMRRVFPAQSQAAHSANGKVRFDGFADGTHVFAIAFDGANTYNQDGLLERNVADKTWSAAFGFGIIRFFDSPGFTVERLADDTLDGHPVYWVRIVDPESTQTIFAIDREDYAIRSVGFDTPRGWHQRIYSDFYWHRDPEFRQPGRVRLYYDGMLTRDIYWTSVKVNQPIADSMFVIASPQSDR